ncbi:MAG TPA: ABC transporter ATP-binding protein [Candidatus Hydrogenedentes bacterium]|nr:ABC transporter ATP-binding protein [Candidatus Hydrogenedentota bacterium]HOT49328.1 ABC transporter ATP-binding protein [Candidatus Hydrogenedentota bacterium]HOV75738.1 ABC transporter ATP-binding protein [Candidatus Hydrogenedentota bacterium]HPC16053.1 ABC transporter ATP-binding protein [Candidatus Hydrogenedentota bacterium]HRT20007.1 ABC transporter ATP-binding protein [Candidatus Hydrogenedentota bacterium]
MESLLDVRDLRVHFHTRNGVARAVDGVSFGIGKGETVGLVGESGSGKSVTAYALLRLIPMPPGRIESGEACFDGLDLLHCGNAELRRIRGRRISMVFQDPMTALNPYKTIGDQVAEPLRVHEGCTRAEAWARAAEMMESVGISNAADRMRSYPHEFSGGMRQRATIAMALMLRPVLLLADEPTTALDTTVQAQILSLIARTQRARNLSVLLITHNLGVVAGVCDRVLIMYAGRMVESAPVDVLFRRPRHPYTQALMEAVPSLDAARKTLYTIPGMPPDPLRPVTGCPFAPRCAHVAAKCRKETPVLAAIAENHASACLRVQEGEL